MIALTDSYMPIGAGPKPILTREFAVPFRHSPKFAPKKASQHSVAISTMVHG
jgi:hypothetical protein